MTIVLFIQVLFHGLKTLIRPIREKKPRFEQPGEA